MNRLRCKILAIKAAIIILPLVCLFLILRVFLPILRSWYIAHQFPEEVQIWETEYFLYSSREYTKENEITRWVEDYYEAFMKEHGEKLGLFYFDKAKPQIHIYGNEKEFIEYHKQRYGSDLPNNAAYYVPAEMKIVLYWIPESERKIQRILYHELTHLILHMGIGNSNPALSRWLDEGLAGYFERCTVRSGRLEVSPLDPAVARFLRQNGLMPISELLAAGADEFQGKNNTHYYYQSYFLVYFLLHAEQGNYAQRFYQYFSEERKIGPCPPEIFWSIMGEQLPSPAHDSELYKDCYHFLLSSPEYSLPSEE